MCVFLGGVFGVGGRDCSWSRIMLALIGEGAARASERARYFTWIFRRAGVRAEQSRLHDPFTCIRNDLGLVFGKKGVGGGAGGLSRSNFCMRYPVRGDSTNH